MSTNRARARLFWTGGSQAVCLPKEMRLPGTEVLVSKRDRLLVVEPVEVQDDWGDFWTRLRPLDEPVRRGTTRRAERRRPV